MTLRPGDCVEQFVIVSELGCGGMGRVYLARDTQLDRLVALKVMRPPDPTEEDAAEAERSESSGIARFLREARAAAVLVHPNVVTIYASGQIGGNGADLGHPFIAMEFVRGKTLRAHIADDAITMAQRIAWLKDVAGALAAAHERGVIHRDIKPENVMIREDGVVKVLDFGLAKRTAGGGGAASNATEAQSLRTITGQGVAIGTPAYMAPEQMMQEPLDGRADQFAWGVLAYELLSRQLPWGEQSDALALVSRVLTRDPEPLETVVADVPPAVAAVVTRALNKSKNDRFSTMNDLLAAMEAPPSTTVVTAPEPAPPPVAPKTGRRRSAYLIGGVAVAVLATIGVARHRAHTLASSAETNAATLRECNRHTDCVKKRGKPAVCTPNQRCADVESDQCKALFEPGDLERDDVVWIGAMLPPEGPMMNAVALARRDVAQATKSFSTPPGTPPVPPLALVACNDASSGQRAARHLADDLHVPAVIGFASTAEAGAVGPSELASRGTLTLSAVSLPATPAPTLSPPRLIWGTAQSDTTMARTIAAFVEKKERDMRRRQVLGEGEIVRVAVVGPREATFASFSEELFNALQFNGKSALQNAGNYREVTFDEARESEEHARIAAELGGFRPSVVLFSAKGGLVPAVEKEIPREYLRPVFVSKGAFDPELMALVGKDPQWRARLYGVMPGWSTTTANARLVVHYNETYGEAISRMYSPTSAYDAFYLVAYATYALGASRPTGAKLAEAFKRLHDPRERAIEVGPSGVLAALSALRRGANIDLQGATGSLDMDERTGTASTDLAVICACVEDNDKTIGIRSAGVTYRAAAARLEGELMRCP